VLKRLKDLFKNGQSKVEPSEDDLKLAAATLMFEVIRSDGRVDKVELLYMEELLRREFKLSQEQLEDLFNSAKETSRDAISLQGFTRKICETWGNAKRVRLLEYLWMLALADERIDPHERHIVRKVAGLLYLNDAEIVIARENAKQEMGIENL